MKIYTKTGDAGDTSLYDGTRVAKDDIRVESYGTVDELTSLLGLAKTFVEDEAMRALLHKMQKDLFRVAGELATTDGAKFPHRIGEGDTTGLEKVIDEYVARMAPVDKFIIPGNTQASAALHVARTVCRRAERRILTLSRHVPVSAELIKYVNRLSDAIYALARFLEGQQSYVEW
ncbi:MAG: Cob(I)yrinic acid a,c-diamide adenosyltransferase [Firmicutes bacterium]|nr:Cob(I)yrinic acid a,c-diamide adenosyltransferase [candidate division NPL-UPA2 bacterium]